jgi:anti-sigma factor RsiW
MNHQPYEDLLLDDAPLTPGEKEMLSQHLATCPQCARLEQSLRALDHEFKVAPAVSPAIGFTSRWQASLPARRKKHEREQTRIILISMATTVVATCITLAAFLIPNISPVTIFVNLFTDLVKLVYSVAQFWSFIGSFFSAIPAGLTIGILITISAWLSLTLLAWGITLYRITLKGLRSTE